MIRTQWLATASTAVLMMTASCSPMTVEPILELTAAPRSIRNDGQQRSVLALTGTDNTGSPGTGSVRVRSAAGSLKNGGTVQLADGRGEVDFTCSVAEDVDCRPGSVRITAEWTTNMKLVETSTSITISAAAPVDSGVPDAGGTPDAGMMVDAGVPDAGQPDAGGPVDAGPDAGPLLDGGTFDGGFFGMYRLEVVTVEKPTILTGVSDETDITFRLTINSASMLPAAGRQATITVDRAATLSSTMIVSSLSAMTDADGRFTMTVGSGNTTRGVISVVASADDARITVPIRAVDVAAVEYARDPMARTTIAVSSTGMATTTPVAFRLRDSTGMPVEGVEVEFSVAANSAAGCTVLPLRDRSNMLGIVRTTLSAGDSQGTATVLARVIGQPDTPSENFNVVIGRVSDGRMSLSCSPTTLGAMQNPIPPRIDRNSNCTLTLADRNGRNPPFALNVSWLSEAGNVPVSSSFLGGVTSTSITFNSGGSLPVPTNPLPAVGSPFPSPAEPFLGSVNPRDNFVSIVAAVQGEEEFWDGSGSSGGLANGTWDPGEYWVDLPEPFADSNDNGVWDPGEPFIDTDRVNCATGTVEPKNMRWDGPNGCWDRATQVWKPTHIVYGGAPVNNPMDPFIQVVPALPTLLPNNVTNQYTVSWTDYAFNRFSSDSASISVALISGTRGQATIASTAINTEAFCQRLEYLSVRAQVLGDGGIIEEGPCDPQAPDSGYPLARCLRTYKFRDWRVTPPTVTMTIVSPMPQSPFSDGGMPPATQTTWELRAQNSLSSPSSRQFTVTFP